MPPAHYCPRCSQGPLRSFRELRDHAMDKHGVTLTESFGSTNRQTDRDR